MTEQFPASPNCNRTRRTKKPIELNHRAVPAITTPGATYQEIEKFPVPSVSRQKAFRIVQYALNELQKADTTEGLRQSELLRLDRMWRALEPRCGDPRVAQTALRIIDRKAKLLGLYDEQPRPQAAVPAQPEEPFRDFSKLSLEELLELERLYEKMRGDDPALSVPKPLATGD